MNYIKNYIKTIYHIEYIDTKENTKLFHTFNNHNLEYFVINFNRYVTRKKTMHMNIQKSSIVIGYIFK